MSDKAEKDEKDDSQGGGGAAFALMLALTFGLGIAKLAGLIDPSWWWVVAPAALWFTVGSLRDVVAVLASKAWLKSVSKAQEALNGALDGVVDKIQAMDDEELAEVAGTLDGELARRLGESLSNFYAQAHWVALDGEIAAAQAKIDDKVFGPIKKVSR